MFSSLYVIYTADMPMHENTVLATFADDTAILSVNENAEAASNKLQEHLNQIEIWSTKWKIKLSESKCTQVTFTLRKGVCPPVTIKNSALPIIDCVKYLGLHMDKRLTWNPHTRLKRIEANRRYQLLSRLLDFRSKLSLSNKILIYKAIIRPVWSYGAEVWGSAKKSNLQRMQTLQSKILRRITNCPYYVSNHTLHKDLNIQYVNELASTRYKNFHNRVSSHSNPLVSQLASLTLPGNPQRRLKRRWPRDLLAPLIRE